MQSISLINEELSELHDAYLILASTGVPKSIEIGRRYPLTTPLFFLGTAKDSHVQIANLDSIVYRVKLYFYDKSWCFENLEDGADIYLNDFLTREGTLKDGDFLRLGKTVFQFLSGSGLSSGIYEQMFQMIRVDFHTGAYNRVQFWASLETWIAFSHRHHQPLSLGMLDIDDFRIFNNKYGHLAGDAVLREVAQRIHKRLRKGDVFCRYGGEEFALILPNTSKENAFAFMEQLRIIVQQEPVVFDGVALRVTFSAGIAVMNALDGLIEGNVDEKELTEAELQKIKFNFVKHADDFLREAKRRGKNQVIGDGL